MKLVGANPKAQIEGLDRLPGISNYFIGNDPAKWRTNIPHYAKIRYRDIYPGIDLVYHSDKEQLEYDLVVAPGSDPALAEMSYTGLSTSKSTAMAVCWCRLLRYDFVSQFRSSTNWLAARREDQVPLSAER